MRFWLDKGVHGFSLIDTTLLFEDKMQRCEDNDNIAKRSLRSEGVSPFFMQNHSYTMNLDETYNIVCEWRQLMDEYKAKDGVTRVLITSAFPTVEDMMRYYGNDTHPGVHLVMNPSFLLSSQKWNASIADLTVRLWQDNMPQKNWATWVTGNANVHRLSERFSPELVDIFHTLALLLPGTALTYYGDEIGMREPEVPYSQTHDIEGLQVGPDNYTQFSTDPARTPFQWDNSTNAGFSEASTTWLPIHSNYEDLNLANEMSRQSHYNLFKKLAHARKWSIIQEGDFKMHLFSPAVLSFCRTLSASDPVFAIINFMDKNETINLMLMKNAKQDMCVYASSENSGYVDRQSVMTSNLILQPTSSLIITTCERANGSAVLTTSSSTVLLLLSLAFAMFARHRLD